MKKSHKVLLGIAVVVVLALGAGYLAFADSFEDWGAGVERISDWEKDYRSQHPGATDKEVDAAFKAGIANITVWMEQYKQDHPGATDADAEAAFNAAWKK